MIASIPGFGGVSPGKVWRVQRRPRWLRRPLGCFGRRSKWVLVPKICWDKNNAWIDVLGLCQKCPFFLSYNKYVNMFKCNDDLCLCQPVLRYVEAVETMKNPWVSWLLFICTWGPTTATNLTNLSLHLKDWLVLGGGQAVVEASSKVLPKAAKGMWSQIMNLYACT